MSHAGVASFFFWSVLTTVNIYFKKYVLKWKLYYEFFTYLVMVLLIGLGNYFLRFIIYQNPNNKSLQAFSDEIIHAILVGFLFFGGFVLYNRFLVLTKFQSSESKTAKALTPIPLSIDLPHEEEAFIISLDQFLFAKAEGNYVEFYLKDGQNVRKELKRCTLKNINDQLKGTSHLVKTHRAFFVNTYYVNKVKGNAQGYQLNFEGIDFIVPVSRNQIEAFKRVMNNN